MKLSHLVILSALISHCSGYYPPGGSGWAGGGGNKDAGGAGGAGWAGGGGGEGGVECRWSWYSSPVTAQCEARLSCSTSCSYPALQSVKTPPCQTDINHHCQEEEVEVEGEGEVRKCETVNMMECEDSVKCEEVEADCDEGEAEVEEVGEKCSEEVREECVPVTEEVCTTLQVTECLENTEEDCTTCREVLEEVEVPCEREEEVCQEMMKPVCMVNRINCTQEVEEMEESLGNTEIIFSTNSLGRKKMTFSSLINETRLEEDLEVDASPEPTMVITRDIINNIIDIEMDGLEGRAAGCIVVR